MSRSDQAEFSAWLREREVMLTKAARAICFDIQNAEDVMQEALADVYVRWRKIRDHENLEAYVIRVMVSKHADLRRKYARRKAENEVSIELVASLLKTADNAELVAERLLVQAALKNLTAAQRSVLFLIYEYGMSIKETAKVLGIPSGTAASHLARGRSAVADYIQFVPGLGSGRRVEIEGVGALDE